MSEKDDHFFCSYVKGCNRGSYFRMVRGTHKFEFTKQKPVYHMIQILVTKEVQRNWKHADNKSDKYGGPFVGHAVISSYLLRRRIVTLQL
jgi:hypothetical protein